MCGIVGFTGAQSAAPLLLDGLKKLEYRGYDSAGIAVMDGQKITVSKVTGRIANLCEKTRDGADVPGSTGIGHTRWATHGAPTEENAHPHLSNDGRFAVVHNGIIENYMQLRDELIRDGYHFESETDTEVIVHLIEMYYRGNMRKALLKTTNRLQGSYALGVICSEEPGKIYAVREASPLILGVGIGENYFASDVTALVNHTRNVIYLEDGEFAELSCETIKIFDCTGQEIRKKVTMLKEIMEQPGAVKATIAPRIKEGKVVFEELGLTASEIGEIRKIIITACGSAYYAGCAGKYAIEKLCRIPVEVVLASELRYSDPLGHCDIPVRGNGRHHCGPEGMQGQRSQDAGGRQCGWQHRGQAGGLHRIHLGRPGNCRGYYERLYHPGDGAVFAGRLFCGTAGAYGRRREETADCPAGAAPADPAGV